jgi:WD40 repeat protein
MPAPESNLKPPPIPDHELLRLIGRGSYGEVWLARSVMGTFRAVKIVHRAAFESERPYEREFAGIQKFEPISRTHDGLVQVLHVGRNEAAGCFYYVMELADADGERGIGGRGAGENFPLSTSLPFSPAGYAPRTLRSDIITHHTLPLDQLLPLSLALTSALGHLHERGLIHRDLKPSNIIFVNRRPKLADIGLVAGLGEARSFVGTEGFVPPEGPGTVQADLYGLGKVLYEASTGKDRLSFPEVPSEWLDGAVGKALFEFHEIVLKACEGQMSRRYQSAAEMQADLAHLQSGRSVRRLHSMERRLERFRRLSVGAAILLALALGAYALSVRQARVEREARQRVERAEHVARELLSESQLERVRANRRSGRAGQRFDSLAILSEAATLRTSLQLRNEAIASLALADLRPRRQWPLSSRAWSLDATAQRVAQHDGQGNLIVRRLADPADVLRLPGGGRPNPGRGAFSPDGRFLASVAASGQLVVWDLTSAKAVREWPASGGVTTEFSADSRHLFLRNGAGPVRMEELATGLVAREFPATEPSKAMLASPAAPYLAIVYARTNLVEVFRVDNAHPPAALAHPDPIHDCQWHPRKPWLATACSDNRIHVWDASTGRELFALEGHQYRPVSVAFHSTDDLLVSSSWDGTTRLWDLNTGRQVVNLPMGGGDLQFSPDGQTLVFADFENTRLHLMEATTERVCRYVQLPVDPRQPDIWSAEFSPDGELLAIAGRAETKILRLTTGSASTAPLRSGFFSAVFEADGGHVVTSGEKGLLRWHVAKSESGALDATLDRDLGVPGERYNRAARHGTHMAHIHDDHIHVLDADRRIARLQGPAELDSIAFSPDGRWIAAGSVGSAVRVWPADGWKALPDVQATRAARVAFSPDSRFLITGTADEFVFWELPGLTPGRRISRENTSALHGPLAFSPDGKTMAIARTRTLIVLLDYPGLTELAALEAPQPTMLSWLAFSPDGATLAASGAPNQIQLWDLRSLRRELAALRLDW